MGIKHCVKSVQIRRYFWSVFSAFSPNTGKYGPEITPYLDTFHAVKVGICFPDRSKILKLTLGYLSSSSRFSI